MAMLEYEGKLWGFLMDDGEVLCVECHAEAANDGQAKKVSRALGTADLEQKGGKNRIYLCDGHRCPLSNP
jgi:hypothetical protein